MKRLAVLLVISLAARAASAADAADSAAAEALFREARELVAKGDFAAACPKFAASAEKERLLGTELNLADCYEKAGRFASAWVTFQSAAEDASRQGKPEIEQKIRERVVVLAPKVPKLSIIVPPSSRIDGLVVTRDERTVLAAEFGSEVPVDPGDHTVTASAPMHKSTTIRIHLAEGERGAPVSIPLLEALPASVRTDARSEADPGRGDGQRKLGLGVGAAGLAGLVVGGIAGAIALGRKSALMADCGHGLANCDPAHRSTVERDRASASSAGAIADLGFIIGGALVASGAAIYLTSPSPARHTAIRLLPRAGSDLGLGLDAQW